MNEKKVFGNNGTIDEQIEFQESIQSIGLNLVSCSSCDGVFFHKNTPLTNTLICPFCKTESDPCDCSDFYYEGMWEQTEELNKE